MDRRRLLSVALPLAAVAAAAAALIVFTPKGEPHPAGKAGTPPSADPVVRRTSIGRAGFRAAPIRGETDVLAIVDPELDTVHGKWRTEKGTLVSGAELPWTRLQLPCFVPEEYDLIVRAERVSGTNSVNIGLAYADRQFVVIFDGGPGGDYAGLDGIEGRAFFHADTAVRRKFFEPGRPRTITCRVRRTRLEVDVDGERVIEWAGDYKKLTLLREWAVMDKGTAFLGSYETSFRFHAVRLVPVRGSGLSLR